MKINAKNFRVPAGKTVNPQGCQLFSFKPPSATELEHDFPWRTFPFRAST